MTRRVRSFVMRGGRLTRAQRRALDDLGPRFLLPLDGPLDLDARFARRAERIVEVGFGTGAALADLAARHPERDFIGAEVYPPGVGRFLAEAEARGLENVAVYMGDAADLFERGLAPASVHTVLVWFPDPWPKKRHHKRRLLREPFVRALYAALAPGGLLRVATDWEGYAGEILALLDGSPGWRNLAGVGCYAPRPETRPETRFESRGERLGLPVFDLAFERLESVPGARAPDAAPGSAAG